MAENAPGEGIGVGAEGLGRLSLRCGFGDCCVASVDVLLNTAGHREEVGRSRAGSLWGEAEGRGSVELCVRPCYSTLGGDAWSR